MDHELCLYADAITETDTSSIPTGSFTCISGTPFDFQQPKRIGLDIDRTDSYLNGGFDNNYVLNRRRVSSLFKAATVTSSSSGITMDVFTTKPGVQLYTGNYLDGTITGKNEIQYRKHQGFCLETQYFPDAVHHPHFPSPLHTSSDPYRHCTVYFFSGQHDLSHK